MNNERMSLSLAIRAASVLLAARTFYVPDEHYQAAYFALNCTDVLPNFICPLSSSRFAFCLRASIFNESTLSSRSSDIF